MKYQNKTKIYVASEVDFEYKEEYTIHAGESKLISFENEAREKYDFNNDYLINLAKRVDKLKNPIADSVYVKASEEIIKSVIKYYVKCEINFLLFNDNIKNLKQKFFI